MFRQLDKHLENLRITKYMHFICLEFVQGRVENIMVTREQSATHLNLTYNKITNFQLYKEKMRNFLYIFTKQPILI